MAKFEVDIKPINGSGGDVGLGGILLFGLIIVGFAYISSWHDGVKREEQIADVEKYCTAEQIKITGTKTCENAINTVIDIYSSDITQEQDDLNQTRAKMKTLDADMKNKCSEKGLSEYGTKGCSDVRSQFESTLKKMKAEIASIKNYEQKIADLNKKKQSIKTK